MTDMNKKCIFAFLISIVIFAFSSCAKDSDLAGNSNVMGSISGVVKDHADGHLLSNCNVCIIPANQSKLTGDDGSFSFTMLKSGSYTLTFSKTGYEDISKNIDVKTGQTVDASVTMKSKGTFSLSANTLNFGDLNNTLSFFISNNSDSQTTFSISNIPAWATFNTTSGTVTAEGTTSVSVEINRDVVEYGEYIQNVVISYKGKNQGDVVLSLSMSKVKQTIPTVTIGTATDITQNGFNIGGNLLETGGSTITAYGHCWSLAHNPTVNDNKSNNGATQITGEFSTSVNNLAVGTTYYVRAYATNAHGTAYSDEVAVVTQDVESNKWDGNIASEFAGGSGSVADPYKIVTGGQLLLMKNYTNKHFILAGNIDLDNKNWQPIHNFEGELDGVGYTIRNLKISRSDMEQGLFANICGNAVVKNLNIKGVNINAGNCSYVGALAGTITGNNIIIDNVNILLTKGSLIYGEKCVGGITGSYDALGQIKNCQVEAVSTDYTIKGSSSVGGICGSATKGCSASIEKCTVKVSVYGGDYIGGILGTTDKTSNFLKVSSCGFYGKVSGGSNVGGIAGFCSTLVACKVDADITGKDITGGVCGGSCITGWAFTMIACYSSGTLTCSSSKASGLNSVTHSGGPILCYTTMIVGLPSNCQDCATVSANGSGTNTATNCTNITQHMKECYSEYANYWNFNSIWTWIGNIKGETKNVSCPRLAWEK